MTVAEWLNGVTITSPFTLDDASALHRLIHGFRETVKADVYTTRGDVVHVCIETERGVIVRDLPIT